MVTCKFHKQILLLTPMEFDSYITFFSRMHLRCRSLAMFPWKQGVGGKVATPPGWEKGSVTESVIQVSVIIKDGTEPIPRVNTSKKWWIRCPRKNH